MTPTKAPARPAVSVDSAAALKSASQWVARAVNPKPTVPILGAVVLTAGDGLLTLSAFDYDTYALIGVPAAGSFPESLYVPGRLFADAMTRLTGDVRLDLDGSDLVLSAGRASFRLRTMPGDEYPSVPPPAAAAGTIDAAAFVDVIHAASVCVGRDFEKNIAITRVRVVAADGALTVWATDRYRAAKVTTPWSGKDFDAIIPAGSLAATLKGLTGTLTIGVDEHRVTIDAADRTVTALRAAGDFPALHRLWADRGDTVHVDRAELVDALSAARMSVEDGKGLHLDIDVDSVVVIGQSERASNRADAAAVGDLVVRYRVNPAYLHDILGVLPGPRVHMAAAAGNHPSKAVEIRPADSNGDPIDGATYLLIPIRELTR